MVVWYIIKYILKIVRNYVRKKKEIYVYSVHKRPRNTGSNYIIIMIEED